MNVHISYKISKTPDLEKLINQQVEKLGRYLRVFRPELVHLKGLIEENSAREGVVVSLNLRLAVGADGGAGEQPDGNGCDQSRLRCPCRAGQEAQGAAAQPSQAGTPSRTGTRASGTVPFDRHAGGGQAEQISAGDIPSYVNVNLPRLQRFIQREIDYRESQGQLRPGQVAVEDVVGEAIANALGEQHDKPERMKLEPWMHRLAMQAIDQLALENREDGHVPLERSHGEQNVHASDEAKLQFHQPDEQLSEENVIPDPTANNPEELAARDELIDLVETTLRDAGRDEARSFHPVHHRRLHPGRDRRYHQP